MNKFIYFFLFLISLGFFYLYADQEDIAKDQNKQILVNKLNVLVFQNEYFPIKTSGKDSIIIQGVEIPRENKFIKEMKRFGGPGARRRRQKSYR